jgi:hypothetical protein
MAKPKRRHRNNQEMTMARSFSRQQSRKLLPMAALAIGALVLAAAPVNVGVSGFGLQQAYAQGDADHGSDKGGAEGSGSDRGADRGSADRGASGTSGSDTGSADPAGHDATDR